jgi:hypothetical protein
VDLFRNIEQDIVEGSGRNVAMAITLVVINPVDDVSMKYGHA